MRPTRIIAVIGSAVLGVALGVTAGVALDRGYQDPLGLGAPMVNQDCQASKAVLVLATGDNPGDLGSDVASHDGARYLETAQSCATAWRAPDKAPATYAAYLGPMDRSTACQRQMTGSYRGAHVTMLTRGTKDAVVCACYVDQAGIPELRPGMDMDNRDRAYLHDLQRLLTVLQIRPDEPVGDLYDAATEQQVKQFQQNRRQNPTGTMGPDTWLALLRRACI